jgi:hypothetical protein
MDPIGGENSDLDDAVPRPQIACLPVIPAGGATGPPMAGDRHALPA